MRILLLRMKHRGEDVGLRRYRFGELSSAEQQLVERGLAPFKKSSPEERRYIRWHEIIAAVPSPNDNFVAATIRIQELDLPVRGVSGLGAIDSPRLYLLDDEMMDQWDRILSAL